MEGCKLIVVDDTQTFSARLNEQLKELGAAVQVFWAPDLDSINELRSNHTIRAYLVSEKWRTNNRPLDVGESLLLSLAEERVDGKQPFAKNDALGETAKKLVKLLVGHTRIIGVFGAGGGAGNTTLCMALAQGLAKHRQRVFMLNVEPYMARSPFAQMSSVGLAEVLVALDDGEDIEPIIRRACCRASRYPAIETFAITEYNADRAELGAVDISAMLETMRRMNRWDVILVDLESHMDDRLFQTWAQADQMILMIPQTAVGMEKLKNVERDLELRQRRGEADMTKLLPVLNFAVADTGNITVLGRPVRLALKDMGSRARNLTSEQWCDAFGKETGYKWYESVLAEVMPE